MKLVSILIPCYNGEKYIKRCLDSCINQTYKDLQIIIVNDGSTDNSKQIIEDYANKYKNINLINQENKGLASTRNVLLNNVKTKYAFFLDVDDWIDQDCISYLMSLNNKHQYDLIINSCYINRKSKDKIFYITNKIDNNTNNYSYLIKNTPFAWGILFNVEYWKNKGFSFCERSQFFEDAGIMSYVIYNTKNIKFINKPVYHYFISDNSLSRNKMNASKIYSAITQLEHFYSLINNQFLNINKYPKPINDQLAFYHCIIFTYIQFQSNITKQQKQQLKSKLKSLEQIRLKLPSRYWKFWYFILYRIFNY